MSNHFKNRIFTPSLFLKDSFFLIRKIPRILLLRKDKKITNTFVKKVMMVTTAVNGCVYCSWFHSKQALSMGIDKEEIRNMMNLQFRTDANEYELPALIYAQHFAETNRKPDPEMTRDLIDTYGEKEGKNILLAIRIISFGNLFGNTWDAILSRFEGIPAEGSSLLFEIIFFLVSIPIMVPATILMRISKNKSSQ